MHLGALTFSPELCGLAKITLSWSISLEKLALIKTAIESL